LQTDSGVERAGDGLEWPTQKTWLARRDSLDDATNRLAVL
jgi:hypothetical protein